MRRIAQFPLVVVLRARRKVHSMCRLRNTEPSQCMKWRMIKRLTGDTKPSTTYGTHCTHLSAIVRVLRTWQYDRSYEHGAQRRWWTQSQPRRTWHGDSHANGLHHKHQSHHSIHLVVDHYSDLIYFYFVATVSPRLFQPVPWGFKTSAGSTTKQSGLQSIWCAKIDSITVSLDLESQFQGSNEPSRTTIGGKPRRYRSLWCFPHGSSTGTHLTCLFQPARRRSQWDRIGSHRPLFRPHRKWSWRYDGASTLLEGLRALIVYGLQFFAPLRLCITVAKNFQI